MLARVLTNTLRPMRSFAPMKITSSTATRMAPYSNYATQQEVDPNVLKEQLAQKHNTAKIKFESAPDRLFRTVQFPVGEDKTENVKLREALNALFIKHQPSKHPFFANLKKAPESVVKNPSWLREFYTRYQAAMHSTRVMVYHTPYLDAPSLRQRKLAILEDDDALANTSHHQDLQAMFEHFGALSVGDQDEFFGELPALLKRVDAKTAHFIKAAIKLYPQSTGAWCVAEVLSDDWLSALADSFSPKFPFVFKERYFDEVFSGQVEIRHMTETVALTEDVLRRHPELVETTINHAKEMAAELDGLWDNLNELVLHPEPYVK